MDSYNTGVAWEVLGLCRTAKVSGKISQRDETPGLLEEFIIARLYTLTRVAGRKDGLSSVSCMGSRILAAMIVFIIRLTRSHCHSYLLLIHGAIIFMIGDLLFTDISIICEI